MIRKLITVAVLSSLSANVLAEEKEERSWDASAELGFNLTSGNTDTTSIKTRIDVTQRLTDWEIKYKFDKLKKKDDEKTTADKTLYKAEGHYILNEAGSFLSVGGTRTEDELGAYANSNTLSFGYGKRFYPTESVIINAAIGPGYTFFEFNEDKDGVIQPDGSSSIVRLSGDLTWEISDSADFSQTLVVDKQLSEDKNAQTRLESSVTAKINGSLQMKFGFTVINNSYLPPDSEKTKTDTETSVTLVYAF